MRETGITEQPTNEDGALVRSIGRALWRAELDPNASVEDRKSSWAESQAKYRQQARKLIRSLEAEGVTLSKGADDVGSVDEG